VTNLSISSAKLGNVSAPAFVDPASLPLLAPGATATFLAQFPLASLPAGATAPASFQGVYSAAGIVGAAWTASARAVPLEH